MIKSIDEYLRLLRKELAGSDAAVIQDALADAEEHLRMALAQAINGNPTTSEAEAIPAIAEKYRITARDCGSLQANGGPSSCRPGQVHIRGASISLLPLLWCVG